MIRRFLAVLFAAVLSLLTTPNTASAATGGPDAFGYYYVDSYEPGGPAPGQIAAVPLGSNGRARLATRTLAAGAHSITATYGGDSNFAGSSTSNPLQQQIN